MNTPFAATTFFVAAAVFVGVQAVCRKSERLLKVGKVLEFGASKTFGIYLLHPMAIGLLQRLGLDTSLCTPLLSIPFLTICTVLLCVPVTVLMSKLPVFKRLIQ